MAQLGAARGAVGAGCTGQVLAAGGGAGSGHGALVGPQRGPPSRRGRAAAATAPAELLRAPSRRRAGAAACRSGAVAFPRAYWRAGCHGNAASPRQRVARQVRRRRGRALPGEGTAPGCAAVATETVILPSNRTAGSSGGPRPARRSARLGMMCVIFFSCSEMSSPLGRAGRLLVGGSRSVGPVLLSCFRKRFPRDRRPKRLSLLLSPTPSTISISAE